MDASFGSLNQLQEGGVSSRRGVNSICGNPEVLAAGVDHPPNTAEELVSIHDELSLGETLYRTQRPGGDLDLHLLMPHVVGLGEERVNVHARNYNPKQPNRPKFINSILKR